MKTSSPLVGGLTIAVLAVALVLSGFGASLALGGLGGRGVSTTTVTTVPENASSNAPYVVTMVVSTENTYNQTVGTQPVFYVLGPSGLQSSAKISLPAGRLIKLVIVNYDEGNASLVSPGFDSVSGTTNGTIFVASNANINSSQGAPGIQVMGGQTVTSIPQSVLSHTFSIPDIGLNIPLPTSSTVVAYFKVDHAGNYLWYCKTGCGFGAGGLGGAMSTPGWMAGLVAAS
ncbi:MAG TPA: hypothetical protein VGS11_04975 [Candidatus Bathyarchaeia archaeon]|nr:hypothetical protein [Candidatus Bathyarchaeia archaeon]